MAEALSWGKRILLWIFHGAFLLNLYLVFSNLRRLCTNLTKKRRGKLHKNVDGERVFYSCLLRVLEWLVGIDISYYDNITLLYAQCSQTYVHGLIRTRICIYVWEKNTLHIYRTWMMNLMLVKRPSMLYFFLWITTESFLYQWTKTFQHYM